MAESCSSPARLVSQQASWMLACWLERQVSKLLSPQALDAVRRLRQEQDSRPFPLVSPGMFHGDVPGH